MRPAKVVLDTNVLFDAALRDAFIRFHLVGLIHVAWSDAILAELDEALTPRLQPPNRERLLAALRALDLVEHGTVNTLVVLPDPNDVHVVQTALAAGADAIVTLDIDDFPDDVLAGYGLEVWSPEDAFVFLFAADQELVLTMLDDQRQALRKPPLDPDQFIARLGRTMPTVATMIGAKWGLPESVERADDMAHAYGQDSPQTVLLEFCDALKAGDSARVAELLAPGSELSDELVTTLRDLDDEWQVSTIPRPIEPTSTIVFIKRVGSAPRIVPRNETQPTIFARLTYSDATGWKVAGINEDWVVANLTQT